MSPEALKKLGNECFKAEEYRTALETYSLALDKLHGADEGGDAMDGESDDDNNDDDDDDDASWETVSSDERETLEQSNLGQAQLELCVACFSNRAAVKLKLGDYYGALFDAKEAPNPNPANPKNPNPKS